MIRNLTCCRSMCFIHGDCTKFLSYFFLLLDTHAYCDPKWLNIDRWFQFKKKTNLMKQQKKIHSSKKAGPNNSIYVITTAIVSGLSKHVGNTCETQRNMKWCWNEWHGREMCGQLQCVSYSCVCECFWEEVSRKRNCYFWFFHKNYRIFFIKFNIKHKYKWIGKRWQWILCESCAFSS